MASSKRRQKEIESMKQSILEAAGNLFQEYGYEETTLRKIATTIEYNPATIYNYYKNKEEIFFALQEKAFHHFHSQFLSLEEASGNAIERLRKMGEVYIRFAVLNPLDYELMFIMRKPMNAAERIDPEWKIGAHVFEMLKDVISECVKEKSLLIKDVESGAFMTWSMVHGLVSLYIMDRMMMIEQDHDKIVEKAFDLFDSMIRAYE